MNLLLPTQNNSMRRPLRELNIRFIIGLMPVIEWPHIVLKYRRGGNRERHYVLMVLTGVCVCVFRVSSLALRHMLELRYIYIIYVNIGWRWRVNQTISARLSMPNVLEGHQRWMVLDI